MRLELEVVHESSDSASTALLFCVTDYFASYHESTIGTHPRCRTQTFCLFVQSLPVLSVENLTELKVLPSHPSRNSTKSPIARKYARS